MLNWFKKIIFSFLVWWKKPPKIGRVDIEPTKTSLQQDVREEHNKLEVNLNEWEDTFKAVFETDNFVTAGIKRLNRPDDETLKQQVQLFFKDYRRLNQKIDQLNTKLVKCEYDDDF
jgi:hypothetical protein